MPPKKRNTLTVSDDILEPDPESPVTYRGLDAALNKHLNKTIDALQTTLDATTEIAKTALALVQKLEKEVSSLKEENSKLKKQCEENKESIRQSSERLEERTNRQLRKTLVFHNIAEQPNETWEDTE